MKHVDLPGQYTYASGHSLMFGVIVGSHFFFVLGEVVGAIVGLSVDAFDRVVFFVFGAFVGTSTGLLDVGASVLSGTKFADGIRVVVANGSNVGLVGGCVGASTGATVVGIFEFSG
jgi:hypothetical protein